MLTDTCTHFLPPHISPPSLSRFSCFLLSSLSFVTVNFISFTNRKGQRESFWRSRHQEEGGEGGRLKLPKVPPPPPNARVMLATGNPRGKKKFQPCVCTLPSFESSQSTNSLQIWFNRKHYFAAFYYKIDFALCLIITPRHRPFLQEEGHTHGAAAARL